MSKMRTSTRYAGGRGSDTRPPRMVMRRNGNGRVYVFYRSPLVIEHTGIGQNWTEVERQGRQAVLRRTSEKVHSFTVTTVLGSNDIYEEVSADLKELDACARALGEFTINYSSRESGVYNMTDFSYTITRRSPRTNEPTRADVSMTFRKTVVATIKTGQVSKPAPKPSPAKKSGSNLGTYTVKKGDTLWAIAGRFYDGKNHLWPKIADANGVKNPRLLQIGHKLKIPK